MIISNVETWINYYMFTCVDILSLTKSQSFCILTTCISQLGILCFDCITVLTFCPCVWLHKQFWHSVLDYTIQECLTIYWILALWSQENSCWAFCMNLYQGHTNWVLRLQTSEESHSPCPGTLRPLIWS